MLSKELDIFRYNDFRSFLYDAWKICSKQFPYFSLRYIASRLDMKSHSSFTQIIRGRLRLNKEKLPKISKLLRMSKREFQYFERLVHYNQAKSPIEQRERLSELSSFVQLNITYIEPRSYEIYTKWYHTAIRALVAAIDISDQFDKIANTLSPSISVSEVRTSIRLLEKLGLIERDIENVLKPTDSIISTGDPELPNAIANYNLQMIDLAKEALDGFPKKQREFSTLTLGISEKSYGRIKEEFSRFRKNLLHIVKEERHADRVYQANFQLFPLMKLES
ncbi:MAG: TIGR02147 family protein [Chitinivibrionales bacterium]|nr:TIGR02147 family protein [Chitinivibrionales bacterium]